MAPKMALPITLTALELSYSVVTEAISRSGGLGQS